MSLSYIANYGRHWNDSKLVPVPSERPPASAGIAVLSLCKFKTNYVSNRRVL